MVTKLAYPEAPTKIEQFKNDYSRYNEFANAFRKKFELEPQEFDIVITVLHHSEAAKSSKIPEVADTRNEAPEGVDFNYVPPILADFVDVARKDPNKLEEKIWILGRMLGYEVEELGHKAAGEARPDAIFISSRTPKYAILLDAKSTEGSYRLGTNYRAIADYVNHEFNRLEKKRGVDRVYFVIGIK